MLPNKFFSIRNYAAVVSLMMLSFGCQAPDKSKEKAADSLASATSDTTSSLHAPAIASDEPLAAQSILFLQKKYENDLSTGVLDSASRRFVVAQYDLNADGNKEILIGLSGSYFCGSGGCTVLLLSSDYKLLSNFTVVAYPLAVASATTKGWNDLVINSNGKFHLIKYNGTKYPSNPSVQPVIAFANTDHQVILNPDKDAKWLKF